MRLDWITIAGAALAAIVVMSLAALVIQHPFHAFSYEQVADRLLPDSGDLGPGASQFMWTYRGLDIVAQAFAIFAAAIACLAMLRSDKEAE